MYKSYWAILLGVVGWVALVGGAIALLAWLSILWPFTPLVIIGVGFVMLLAFVIWVEQP